MLDTDEAVADVCVSDAETSDKVRLRSVDGTRLKPDVVTVAVLLKPAAFDAVSANTTSVTFDVTPPAAVSTRADWE